MSSPIFIDKDAEWLWSYSQQLLASDDSDLMTGLRLSKIAERIERMNAADMERLSKGDFAAGAMDMAARIYSRSNLPVEDRAMPVAIAKTGIKPRVVPSGATAKSIAKLEKKAAEEKRVLSKLSGIKLNLGSLTKPKQGAE